MNRAVGLLALLAAGVVAGFAQATVVDFNSDAIGSPSPSFSTALTGNGRPGQRVLMKDAASPAQGNLLARIDDDRTSYRFPVCVYDTITARDVDVSVAFKPRQRARRPGSRHRLALPRPGQLLHRAGESARGQHRALQAFARPVIF